MSCHASQGPTTEGPEEPEVQGHSFLCVLSGEGRFIRRSWIMRDWRAGRPVASMRRELGDGGAPGGEMPWQT